MMKDQLFKNACEKIIDQEKHSNGIGTLSEKTIHAVLKHYCCEDESCHEKKVSSYVADILIGDEIIEIQTRNFNTMRKKLEAFLPDHQVTIVYPVVHTKWLRWINEETGEISAPRKSPKTGSFYEIFRELYRIKPYLKHPNLHFKIVRLNVEEYRMLNGWSHDKKRGSTRNDGIPVGYVDELCIDSACDYRKLLPDDLPVPFTTKDYKKSSRLPQGHAVTALNILYYMGVVERVGKQGNAFLYKRIEEKED